MKKVSAILLAILICLSLCACGGAPSSNETQNIQQPAQETESVSEEKISKISLGEEIELDFARITFNAVELGYSVGGHGFSSTAQDDMRMFCIVGQLENTGGNNLPVQNIKAEMKFNGEYAYTAEASATDSNSLPASVAPLTKVEYVLYAEIPETLIELLSECELHFAINDKFASVPDSAENGDHDFVMNLDEETCKAAVIGAEEAHDFFEECPILPTPVNYAPVYEASHSSSTFNGKTSDITYRFSVSLGRSDNLEDIYKKYTEKLQTMGFAIGNDSGSSCDLSSNGTKLATVYVEGSSLKFEIIPGNENVEAPSEQNGSETPQPAMEAVLKIGDTIKTDYASMTIEKNDSGKQITSGTSQYGRYTYYESQNGDPYFYIFGTFKNLGGKPVDIRNIYVQFCFDDKYNYRGEVDGVSALTDGFINDVSPLAEVNYYIYTAVPRELIDSFSMCRIKIGFTEDFDYKVTDVNDLPQFEMCDDVFVVEIPANR